MADLEKEKELDRAEREIENQYKANGESDRKAKNYQIAETLRQK